MPKSFVRNRTVVALLGLAALSGCARESASEATARAEAAQRGKDITQARCSICHEVMPGQPTGIKNAGPGFALIANKAGRDREYLTRFMGEWHDLGKIDMAGIPMPTILLSDAQRADVITYILTYRLDLGTGAPTPAGVRPF